MTIAITGAGGMIGAAVLAALQATGRPVRVLTHAPRSDRLAPGGRALPSPRDDPAAFEAALEGATHVIHCAAMNSDAAASADDMLAVNGLLVGKLARAASRAVPGRFIHLSSIRAVAGADWSGTIDEHVEPRPTDAYGRSKLAGEDAAKSAYAGLDGRMVILRPAPVYGPEMRGAMRALLRLAHTPWPLPLATLPGAQPVLSLPALVNAILLLLDERRPTRSTFVVSDPLPLSLAEIVGAYRNGLGRPAKLFSVPASLLGAAAALSGKTALWKRTCARQACDPSGLVRLGWQGEADSRRALALLAADLSRRTGGTA